MQSFFSSLGKHKFIMIALLAVGAALIIIASASSKGENSSQSDGARGEYERSLEARLTALCLSVEGIEEATVLVTADTSNDQSRAQYYSSPSAEPTVRGVAAVVTNGDDPVIKKTLTELISASLGLPTNRVSVAPCK